MICDGPFREADLIESNGMRTGLMVLLLAGLTAPGQADQPMNLVLILADDLGWADTTLYGQTSFYETPNIQRLASRGMIFPQAYASPICSPTRASIMTGQNPARSGMTAPSAHLEQEVFTAIAADTGPPHQKCTNVRSATRLDSALPTLGTILQQAGYATAHFGKWHLGREPHSPLQRGFDVDIPHWWGPGPKTGYLAPWDYPDLREGRAGEHIEDRMAEEATTWLKQRDPTRPFYMNYWQFSVHAPFGAKPELIEHYRKKVRRGEAQQSPTYAAMVHSLDEAVGRLLDALDAEGIADRTIIVFYSDNGGNIHCGLEETDASGEEYITAITSNHPLRGGKGGILEGGVRVPAVVVWPGVTPLGSRNQTRIQSTDLFPTLLNMLNLQRPSGHVIDGVDFSAALVGRELKRPPMFTHVPGHGNTPEWLPPSMSVHYEQWKLIRTFYYGENGQHQYRLYNLEQDIGEQTNLAETMPGKVRELDALIEGYIRDADVVVPRPNPKFDPARFDPALIGVQAGGLKMPQAAIRNAANTANASPLNVAPAELLQGWIVRNADSSMTGESLLLEPQGRQSFLANARIRADGPITVTLRLWSRRGGVGKLQWRAEGQERFPETGQTLSFAVEGAEWQEIQVAVNEPGKVIHLRVILPEKSGAVEIDWLEVSGNQGGKVGGQRWDFQEAAGGPSVSE